MGAHKNNNRLVCGQLTHIFGSKKFGRVNKMWGSKKRGGQENVGVRIYWGSTKIGVKNMVE